MKAGPVSPPRLIALDWGTSVLRAYLLGDRGAVLEERKKPWGILHLPEGGYETALDGIAGDWREASPGITAIACGMVGSANGFREAPYVACPAGEEALAEALLEVEINGLELHIVPGVKTDGERPDVMRGEETQVVGSLARSPHLAEGALLVMPGTHSKWVQVRARRILGFRTYMTGELFALLSEHSILGRPARSAQGSPSDAAFERGVSAVHQHRSTGATALLFSTRALVLSGQLRPEDSLEYLSGLLVGDELRCALSDRLESSAASREEALTLVGDLSLCDRYRRALTVFGREASPQIEGASAAGLWRIARRAGLCVEA
jgi:2-dehydro-3-deoxygalactonokinase